MTYESSKKNMLERGLAAVLDSIWLLVAFDTAKLCEIAATRLADFTPNRLLVNSPTWPTD